MYTTLLTDATLFDAVIAIDQDLTATAQAGGCHRCPGRFQHGDYPRKPCSGLAMLPTAYETCTSFCCARCRKRVTPASVRFLGRRVYLGAIVVLACVLRQGPTPCLTGGEHAVNPAAREHDVVGAPNRDPVLRRRFSTSASISGRMAVVWT